MMKMAVSAKERHIMSTLGYTKIPITINVYFFVYFMHN